MVQGVNGRSAQSSEPLSCVLDELLQDGVARFALYFEDRVDTSC